MRTSVPASLFCVGLILQPRIYPWHPPARMPSQGGCQSMGHGHCVRAQCLASAWGFTAVSFTHPLVWPPPPCGHLPDNDHVVLALLTAPNTAAWFRVSWPFVISAAYQPILSALLWDRCILSGRDYEKEEPKARPWRGEHTVESVTASLP